MDKKILIVEDEKPIANILEYGFKKEDFLVKLAHTGGDGLAAAEEFKPNIVLLDWMLPDLNGVDVCRMLTEKYNIPIIMLTARNNMNDKLYGLESGADDYITKPFDLREVIARVKTVLRRFEKVEGIQPQQEQDVYYIEDISIYENERIARKANIVIELTPKEFDLVLYFIKHPKQVFTRMMLLEQIWGYDFMGDTRTVDIHVQRLRKKLGLQDTLVTVFGVGYKYVP